VFDASPDIVIPAGNSSFCQLEFDVTVLGFSNDATPATAEETVGYNAAAADGQCNNGLSSSGAQSGSIPLCLCDDGDPCTDDTCDSSTFTCTFTPNGCPPTTTTTTVVTTTIVTTTSTTTTTATTTTTLAHGCAPPDTAALRCEKAIAKALAALVKSLVGCSVDDAKSEVGTTAELSADGDACEADAKATFDAALAKIGATGDCPSEVLANASAVRDDAIAATLGELGEIFVCPAP
jgi:hypothetical protein